MTAPAHGLPHVLIVEDDSNAADALRILFEETGHRVSLAYSAARAEKIATEDTPDLLLLDLSLPDGDGLDVLDRLRAAGTRIGTVVALTGHEGHDLEAQCREHGCTDLLTKPVSIRELIRRAPGWIAASHSRTTEQREGVSRSTPTEQKPAPGAG
jgi:DNA-binding response OmpR family regulator